MSSFGAGLGQVIGSEIGASDLNAGLGNVNNTAAGFGHQVAPYNTFGQSFIAPATAEIGNLRNYAGGTQGYEDFLKNYQTSPGAQYEIGQATAAQNESAAATGQLLSGANERALSEINQGIAGKYANQAYTQYLQGNQQQFGQLESSLGNMFNAIGVGTTATGQQAGVTSAQMNNQAQIAQAQAKNDQGKGSGFGSMFNGLFSLATAH